MATRVMIVDDSFFMRRSLERIFSQDPEIEIAGAAKNGREALEKITPDVDVVTLDILMPVMDGLAALKEMRQRRMRQRVIMVSALTSEGAEVTIQALRLGAEDFILKPQDSISSIPEEFSRELISKVKALKFHVRKIRDTQPAPAAAPPVQRAPDRQLAQKVQTCHPDIVLIGSSTGGPAALRTIFSGLPGALSVPIVIAQHMPPLFTMHLAKDLSTAGKIRVMEAEDRRRLQPGVAVMAPGGRNLQIKPSGSGFVCEFVPVPDNPAIPSPSVNVLFSSLESAGKRVLAVLLTGLGSDGADGMVRLRNAGAVTLAQDEETSLVYGMPRVAHERGGVDESVGLHRMAERISSLVAPRAENPKAGNEGRDRSFSL